LVDLIITMFFHQSDQFVTDFCTVITENLKIKRDLPGKLKFDWNSTSHQSGTEELHERACASYLGNIQRNRDRGLRWPSG
jgi:hypothetical protein